MNSANIFMYCIHDSKSYYMRLIKMAHLTRITSAIPKRLTRHMVTLLVHLFSIITSRAAKLSKWCKQSSVTRATAIAHDTKNSVLSRGCHLTVMRAHALIYRLPI